MTMPMQGTGYQQEANAMTNRQLSESVKAIMNWPRSGNRAWRDAVLREAAIRLYWPDNYAKHQEETLCG